MGPIKSRIGREVDALAGDLHKVSEFLYNNAEIGYQEFRACKFLSRFMEERGSRRKGDWRSLNRIPGPAGTERGYRTLSLGETPTEEVCARRFFYRHP